MMERNHGHIVSVASIAGVVGAYQLTDYCASKFGAVGLEESLRLELNCDGYDGIHSTVVCPYYIATGMFSGISRSLIPILTPEYVVNEAVKAILVNQEVVCLPDITYFIVMAKGIFPTKTFLWFHRAIGAASTMKTFTGRTGKPDTNGNQQGANQQALLDKEKQKQQHHISIKLNPQPNTDIGINIPPQQQLTQ